MPKRLVTGLFAMAICVSGLFAGDQVAVAMNWEGHVQPFDGGVPAEFLEGVPPPKVKPLEKCTVLAERHAVNRYEQVPVPGKNCKA